MTNWHTPTPDGDEFGAPEPVGQPEMGGTWVAPPLPLPLATPTAWAPTGSAPAGDLPSGTNPIAPTGADADAPPWWVQTPQPAAAVPPQPHRRLIRVLSGLAAALLVLGVVVAVVGSSGSPSASASEAVTSAALTTLADKTAHLDLSGSINVMGQSITMTGSGDADFANNEMSMQANMSVLGQQMSIQEIFTGQTMYESIPDLGTTIAPGKSWISLDLSSLGQAGSLNPGMSTGNGADAGAMLQILSQEGATVTPLGTSDINGTTVSGYTVSFDKAAIEQRLGKLPDWVQQSASQFDLNGLHLKVYVDGSGMLRRMTIDLSLNESGVAASGNMNLDLSDFGAPVSVTAPPADQVISLQQLMQQMPTGGTPAS